MTSTVAEGLTAFVQGSLRLEDLEAALKNRVDFRYFDRDERRVGIQGEPLPIVAVQPSDVERILKGYLAGKCTRRDVSDWAATIRLLDCFEVVAATERATDRIWGVLDELMSPDAWDELTVEAALELIRKLNAE